MEYNISFVVGLISSVGFGICGILWYKESNKD